MYNVYDIKYNKNLNFILPVKHKLEEIKIRDIKNKVAVIVHLHYLDTIKTYLKYIEAIPVHIDIYLACSDPEVISVLSKSTINRRDNVKIINKRNRGRDISTLLVACRKYIMNYEYICFLHDKKEKRDADRKDVEGWIRSLWENMIGSAEYIDNVLATLSQNSNLGLLVPPFFMGEHIVSMYDNDVWYSNYELTKKLAEQMELQCDLDKNKPPVTLGTVFWARVSALEKLFKIEWQYEDFEDEPLGNDATVSHAIERILAYVAQDAGFDTGWVMTDRYMGEYFNHMQDVLKKAFCRLKSSLGIWQVSELYNYEDKVRNLTGFIYKYKKYYIYGAGVWGRRCLAMLLYESKMPDAFLVSDSAKEKNILGIPVFSMSQIKLDMDCGIVIAVDKKYQEEILSMVKNNYPEFSNIFSLV